MAKIKLQRRFGTIKNWRPGRLAKNTMWQIAGQSTRILIQAAYFVLIARLLGPHGYGAFAGVAALTVSLAALSDLGMGHVIVQRASREPNHVLHYWSHALRVIINKSWVLAGSTSLILYWLLPPTIPVSLIILVAVSDLIFAPFVLVTAQAFQALQQLARVSYMMVMLASSRLIAVLLMWSLASDPNPTTWAIYYLTSSATSGLLAVLYGWRHFGSPKVYRKSESSGGCEGIPFSLSVIAQRAHNDIDKTLLVRLDTLHAAGVYSASYRIIDVAHMPINALYSAAYARFFIHGKNNPATAARFALKLLPATLSYSLICALTIYLMAPLAPKLLGQEFSDTVEAIRWLALLPFISSIYNSGAYILTGSGFQHIRTTIDLIAMISNILLNFYLIPSMSYHGAVLSAIFSKTIAALGAVHFVLRQTKTKASLSNAPAKIRED